MIKAIIFDLDDTLYDQKSPFTAALTKTFNQALSSTELAQILTGSMILMTVPLTRSLIRL